jgi:hypothetical protein
MRVRLAVLIVATAVLAGCSGQTPAPSPSAPGGNGVAALSAEEIWGRAHTALMTARSVRLTGDIPDRTPLPSPSPAASPKPSTTPAPLAGSVNATFVGKDGQGTFTTHGITAQFIRIGPDIFIKAPDSTWTSLVPAQLVPVVGQLSGKWLKLDAAAPVLSNLAPVTNPEDLLQTTAGFTKGDLGTVNGKPAIALVARAEATTLWISTEGAPVPLRLDAAPGQLGAVTFSDYDAVVELTPPPAAEVFDLKSLMGG